MKIIPPSKVNQNQWVAALQTRKNQLWLLIILSALTMTIPYYIQGGLVGGKAPGDISATAWQVDQWAWAIRAVVEGLVIGYIARTDAKRWWETSILWALEVALIGLIAITLGPALYASMNSSKMLNALPDRLQWVWAFALASYMPLMVLGASYAYRLQPDEKPAQEDAKATQEKIAEMMAAIANRDEQLASAARRFAEAHEIIDERNKQFAELTADAKKTQEDAKAAQEKIAELTAEIDERDNFIVELDADAKTAQVKIAELAANAKETQTQLAAMQTAMRTIDEWSILPPTAQARWVAQHTNGDRPAASDLAKALRCSVSTVTRAYNEQGGAK